MQPPNRTEQDRGGQSGPAKVAPWNAHPLAGSYLTAGASHTQPKYG